MLSSTFLQEWEAFYIEFKNSTTYALAHSSATSLLPSLVDDDDANDDRKLHECNIDKLPTNSSAGLRRLRHAVRELEKVNIQFANFLEFLDTPAPCKPTLRIIANNLQYPQPCPECQRDGTPQYVPMIAPPLALNPSASPIQYPTQQSSQTDHHPSTIPGTMSLVTHPAPKPVPSDLPRPSRTKPTTTPNWAKPAVPTPASKLMAGMSCAGKNHWPPP